ncbi:hypothetical protein R6Q59_030130, partial [Mikania micrantha]
MQRFGSSMTATSSNVTCIEEERRSLLAIKRKITDRHNLLSTWSRVECCEWRGIMCDSRNGHVVKLDLRSPVYWEDEIPEFLGSFEHLEYINLSGSGFSDGVVPHHLGNLSRLQVLDLSTFIKSDEGVWDLQALIADDLRWVSSLSSL